MFVKSNASRLFGTTACVQVIILFYLFGTAPAGARGEDRDHAPASGFAFESKLPVRSIGSLKSVISAATALHPNDLDIRDYKDKLLRNQERKPTILLIVSEQEQTRIKTVQEATQRIPVTVTVIEVTDSLTDTLDGIAGGEEHAGTLLVSVKTLDAFAKHISTDTTSLFGVYAFGPAGEIVWYSPIDRNTSDELSSIAKTLASLKMPPPPRAKVEEKKPQHPVRIAPIHPQAPIKRSEADAARVIACGSERSLALSELLRPQGHGLVVNVWATWCPGCRAEMSDLAELRHRYGKGISFVGILIQPHSDDLCNTVRSIVPAELLPVQYAAQNLGAVTDRFFAIDPKDKINNVELPLTLIFGADGKLLRSVTGSIATDPHAKETVTDALKRAAATVR